MRNIHVIEISTTKENKIKIVSHYLEQCVIVPFTNAPGDSNPAISSAINYLSDKGFKIEGIGEGDHKYYLTTGTFDKRLK